MVVVYNVVLIDMFFFSQKSKWKQLQSAKGGVTAWEPAKGEDWLEVRISVLPFEAKEINEFDRQ